MRYYIEYSVTKTRVVGLTREPTEEEDEVCEWCSERYVKSDTVIIKKFERHIYFKY